MLRNCQESESDGNVCQGTASPKICYKGSYQLKYTKATDGRMLPASALARISVDKQKIKRHVSVLRTVLTVSIVALRTLLIHTKFS